jgi:hypothetical protein
MSTDKNLLLEYVFNQKPENAKYYDFLKEIYDVRMYHYGGHFKYHFENSRPWKERFWQSVKNNLISAIAFLRQKRITKQPTVLSTVYFNADLFLKNHYGINVSRPPWAFNSYKHNIYDWNLHKRSKKLRERFTQGNFYSLTTDAFINEIKAYQQELKAYVLRNNIIGLFLAQDVGFFEKLAIDVFKELNRPSFAFVHGLQFWLNEVDWSRTDYLVVWGELSKKDFIQHGFSGDRILVSGHPVYKKQKKSIRFGLEHVLVLANSLNGITPSEEYLLTDRSNCIYYLQLIQESLQKLGVKKAYLRPHPSENPEWYRINVDPNFFILDRDPIAVTLEKSSLVIGPTSTVLLEALQYGVNYTVFNPENQYGKGLNGLRTPPFFDGYHDKIPVAKSSVELESIIKEKKAIDVTVLDEIMAEQFSMEEVHSILQRNML